MLNRSNVGEWAYILTFCLLYALIANIESRMFPAPESLAARQRAWVNQRINEIGIAEEKKDCTDLAVKLRLSKAAVVWYHNKETGEYWCGHIVLENLTQQRAEELRDHVEILNSDKNLRRLRSESNKHQRKQGNLSEISDR